MAESATKPTIEQRLEATRQAALSYLARQATKRVPRKRYQKRSA